MSVTENNVPGVLDLSGADTSGFEAMEAGRYPATIFEAAWVEAKGEGKMPAGHPYLNVQFRISEDGPVPEYKNRRVFAKYFPVPYEGQEPDKASKMQGSFVNLLTELGYEDVKSKKFKLDLEDMKGKACVVAINKKYSEYAGEMQNNVTGVKSADSVVGSAAAGGLL